MVAVSINGYEGGWGIGYFWHRMDLLVRADVVVLVLLFAYTVAVAIRIFRRYHAAPYDGDINRATQKKLAAKLNIQAGNLKSIASTAPYLGTVGTCLGIMGAFTAFGMEKNAAVAMTVSRIAAALVPAAAGIIVAIPATCAYEYARTQLDLLVNQPPGRKRLLTGRFTLPPFGLIGAYGLVILVQAFISFAPIHAPKGFDIGIAPVRCDPDLPDENRVIVLHISDGGRVFLNFDEVQDWSTLQSRLSEIYTMRAERVLYLWADEGVRFQTVADAIDSVENAPEGVTSHPLDITVQLITPTMNAPCREHLYLRSSSTDPLITNDLGQWRSGR